MQHSYTAGPYGVLRSDPIQNHVRKGTSSQSGFPDLVSSTVAPYLPFDLPTSPGSDCFHGSSVSQFVPGILHPSTLLYAPEIKFFATQVETASDLETKIKGMYVAGDGPGVAGNIVSASATGLIPAKAIIAKG